MGRQGRLFGLLAVTALGAVTACSSGEREPVVPEARELDGPYDEFSEPFTGPIRLAELPDRRVLALDVRERRLVRLNFEQNEQVVAARNGLGPLEYRSGLTMVQATADSVWMFDIVRAQVLVFSPEGEPVRSFSTVATDGDPMSRLNSPWLRAVASDGSWFGRVQGMVVMPRPSISDSIAVVRVDGASGARDTIALIQAFRTATAPPGQPRRLTRFDAVDAWGVFADGRVIVVRGETYAPTIIQRDGTRNEAPVVPHTRVPLARADAEYVLDSTARLTGQLVASAIAQSPLAGRAGVNAPPSVALPDPLPATWPLFAGGDPVILVDSRDRAWVPIRESPFDSSGVRYDLLDRDGAFLEAIRLPHDLMLVGFGREALYVARRDADDLLWLRRYPLP
jgi:hypothetical protein